MSNYYSELEKTVDNLFSSDKFDEALKLIEEELSMPYVPLELEKKFKDLKFEIISQSTTDEVNSLFSIDKLNILIKDSKIDFQTKIDLVFMLNTFNLDEFKEDIDELFDDKSIDLSIKTRVLDILIKQNSKFIEENVRRISKTANMTIDTSNIMAISDRSSYKENLDNLNELLMKYPILFDISKHLLEQVLFMLYFKNNLSDISLELALISARMVNDDESYNEILESSGLSEEQVKENILELKQYIV